MSENEIEIQPSGPLAARVRPPGSKSITNRALVCAALAKGDSHLTGVLDSQDTRVMADALAALGIPLTADWDNCVIDVHGCDGKIPSRGARLYVANSGTTVRFLTAMVALGHGEFILDGTARMRERPIQDLLDALGAVGVKAASESPGGCPPVRIDADGLPGGVTTVRGDVSSQFLSGLLMAAPYATAPLEIKVSGELVSQPYIRMTLAVMRSFGVLVKAADDLTWFAAPRGTYQGRDYAIEPDASAASYFFAAAAIAGGTVTVEGLGRDSLQGDVQFVDVLRRMGARVQIDDDAITVEGRPLEGVTVDMNAISDTVQTLGAVALFARGPTTIERVGHIRHKETDRLSALATELRKFGAQVEEWDDGLRITPGSLHAATIDTYDDHRMAMSMALVGLRVPGVRIRDPGCTAKTYPRFFEDLANLAKQK